MRNNIFNNLLVALTFAAASLTVISGAHAATGDTSVNAEISYVSGPDYADGSGSYDSGYGFGVGGGFEVLDNIEARAEINYHLWNLASASSGFSTASLDLTNTQVGFGGRYNLPLSDTLKVYGGLGLTYNSFKVELALNGTTLSSSDTESKIGLEPGVGVALDISNTLSIYFDARYNMIKDFSYLNAAIGLTLNYGKIL